MTTCADSAGRFEVTVQTCRSCTSWTCSVSSRCARTSVQVDALRGGFQQDPAGVAQQPPRGLEHQRDDDAGRRSRRRGS